MQCLAPQGFLQAVADWCTANGVVFIADEVQTGFARTGEMFACEQEGIVPDIVTDQTSAHDLVYGYVPKGMSLDEVRRLRVEGPLVKAVATDADVKKLVPAYRDCGCSIETRTSPRLVESGSAWFDGKASKICRPTISSAWA